MRLRVRLMLRCMEAMHMSTSPRMTPRQRMQIAIRANRALITVDRLYAGKPGCSTSRAAIEQAAHELGLPPPPAATPSIRAARCA